MARSKSQTEKHNMKKNETIIEEDDKASIPYASAISMIDDVEEDFVSQVISPEEAKVITNDLVVIKF